MAKTTPKPEPKPPPKCKAILLCERTIIEAGTEKVNLIGITQSLTIADFPGRTAPMELYLQLVDGIGRYDLTLEINDLTEIHSIARGKGPSIFMPDRLTTFQLFIPIPALPIVNPGRYDIIVFANNQEIDRQQFIATESEDHGGMEK